MRLLSRYLLGQLAAPFLFGAQLLSSIEDGTLIAILRESLLIGGWVAMWRPMEIFLYERWPGKRQQELYTRLSNMQVKLSVLSNK